MLTKIRATRIALVMTVALTGPVATAPLARARQAAVTNDYAVGAQYDTTHVYVAPDDFDRFVESVVKTFGGSTSKKGVFQVTPTTSETMSQLILTPVGTISAFGFKTPVPHPFGVERSGYLVRDIDGAVEAATKAGADVLVSTFPDPIGRDVVLQWPGGVNMQLYWHTTAPHYAALKTVPENRVYVSPLRAEAFVRALQTFSHARIVSDDAHASGAEIGRAGETIRRIRLESGFGRFVVYVTDGHLPYPYGKEMTGYEVQNIETTLEKAKAAGGTVLVAPVLLEDRRSAIVQFPGGYVAEIHAALTR